jgi:hypothetical protein
MWPFRSVIVLIAGLTPACLPSPLAAQLGGTNGALSLQTNCEQAISTSKITGVDTFITASGEALECLGFMNAIQSLSGLGRDGHTLTYLCLPEKGDLMQLVRVVVAYGQRHPEKLSGNAAQFVLNALEDAFPCPH